jgi:Flp pilus assembly pilin Flp
MIAVGAEISDDEERFDEVRATVEAVEEEEEEVVFPIGTGGAFVGLRVIPVVVAVVVVVALGSFDTRLLATFSAAARSALGMDSLAVSQPVLTGVKKVSLTSRSSSLQW